MPDKVSRKSLLDVWARSEKRGTGGRVDDFTEDGRLRDQMGKGIVIWKRRVYDCDGVCLITQLCLIIIKFMYVNNIPVEYSLWWINKFIS